MHAIFHDITLILYNSEGICSLVILNVLISSAVFPHIVHIVVMNIMNVMITNIIFLRLFKFENNDSINLLIIDIPLLL